LGLHFGHYKATSYSPILAHLYSQFTQLVFMTGLSLSQFQAGLQVILEKSWQHPCGNLHAILLMEGDLNVVMKIFIGTHMIANALHLNLIPAKCYGSCPGCTAMQVSLTHTLTADITR